MHFENLQCVFLVSIKLTTTTRMAMGKTHTHTRTKDTVGRTRSRTRASPASVSPTRASVVRLTGSAPTERATLTKWCRRLARNLQRGGDARMLAQTGRQGKITTWTRAFRVRMERDQTSKWPSRTWRRRNRLCKLSIKLRATFWRLKRKLMVWIWSRSSPT